MRYFSNTTYCPNQCVEVLMWTRPGQDYELQATVAGANGTPPTIQKLTHVLMTSGDMDGLPFSVVSFESVVPGNGGPVYIIGDVPPGAIGIDIITKRNPQQQADKNFRNVLPPVPGCISGCPWTHNTSPNPAALALAYAYFGNMH
jgi:hypothetical protein